MERKYDNCWLGYEYVPVVGYENRSVMKINGVLENRMSKAAKELFRKLLRMRMKSKERMQDMSWVGKI